MPEQTSNFEFLKNSSPPIYKVAADAEKFIHSDPDISLFRLRQFVEFLAKEICALIKIDVSTCSTLDEILKKLNAKNILTPKIKNNFYKIKKVGNDAVHEQISSQGSALHHLQMARDLAIWYQESFVKQLKRRGPFVPPPDPQQIKEISDKELEELKRSLISFEKRAEILKKERDTAMGFAQEMEDHLKELETLAVTNSDDDINEAIKLAKVNGESIVDSNGEGLMGIVQIKYYLEGFRYGGEKYSDLSQNELNEIRTIFGKSDDAISLCVRVVVASIEQKSLQFDRAIERLHDNRIFTGV